MAVVDLRRYLGYESGGIMKPVIYGIVFLILANAVYASSYNVEKISTGYQFTEGPVWSPRGTLLFSDTPSDRIWEIGLKAKVYREPSGESNGLAFDWQGRLIVCEHGNRRVTRIEKDGRITVLADRYEGKRLNSPNDIVVRSDGSIYFTDTTYGIDPKDLELTFRGVFRIRPDSKLELLVKDFGMPNGLCFSPDESKLYIADSSELRHIRVFNVSKDGKLSGGAVFAVVSNDGVPDGMKTDKDGKLYAAGPGGIWIWDKDGKYLDKIPVPETPANLTWGGSDGKMLYITARTSIYKVRLKVGGR